MMIQGIYALWLARNETREGKKIEDPGQIAKAVVMRLEEWQRVMGGHVSVGRSQLNDTWKTPEQGWLKANVDGAMLRSGVGGGGGVIFRDEHGAFRGAASVFFPDTCSAEVAELLACRRAVQEAVQRGVQKLHLETDCQTVAGMLNEKKRNLSAMGQVVEEVKSMCSLLADCKITWVRRTANRAAHVLAKLGISNRASMLWDLVPPDCILSIVSDEIFSLV